MTLVRVLAKIRWAILTFPIMPDCDWYSDGLLPLSAVYSWLISTRSTGITGGVEAMHQFAASYFPSTVNAPNTDFYCKYNDLTLAAYSAIMHFTVGHEYELTQAKCLGPVHARLLCMDAGCLQI